MTQRNISGVCFLFCLVVTFATGQPLLRPAGGRDSILRPNAQISTYTRSVWLDENRLRILLNNRGELDYKTPYDGGAFWPDTTNSWQNVVVFDCGPWVVGKLAGQPKMAFSQWGSSYSPGPVIGGKAAMIARPADSLRYRLYKVASGDSPLTNPDYREWPADLGAPLDAEGKPRIYGDQTVWTVYNNLDPNALSDWWKARMALPGLPVEIRQMVYEYDGGDTTRALSDVAFFEWTIINRGDAPIESTYVSLWTDIDFTDAGSNRPAVDTANQLGYCWQARDFYLPPKAVGFVWLYGPAVPSPGDRAVVNGRVRPDYRNLPITSFWGIQDDSFADSSFKGPAYSMGTAWNIARGFDKAGNPVLDSVTHQVTKFLYNGDPVTGTGWLCNFSSGGAGFNIFSGPFTFAPGDTQWVMTALIPVRASDRLECIRRLRQSAARLRAIPYDSLARPGEFQLPVLPPTPVLYQNYPNPFNASTSIRYALSSESDVSLEVYNVMGQRVRTFAMGVQAIGYHEERFNGSNLASGVYFYRLQAGSFTSTKRLMLLR